MLGRANKQGSEASADKGGKGGRTLMSFNLAPIILVVIVVLVSGYLGYMQYAGLVKQAQQVQHVADAERMAALLGGRLLALGEQVGKQARAAGAMAGAIAQGDQETLGRFERGLQAYFPDAVRIRILLPSATNPDMSVTPPIGYACLDLARQAEAGIERPPLEIHLQGQEHAHLDLVRPILRDGRVLASLMVSFPPEQIDGWLAELVPETGFVELQQGWEGPVLGQVGDAALMRGNPTHRAVIPGSSWQLSYWASDGIGMAEAHKLGFLATFVVAAVAAAAIIFAFALMASKTIKRELMGMAEFMLQSSRGKRFHSYPVTLVELEQALQMMEPVLSAAKPNEGLKQKAEQGDAGVPDMMFVDFGEITVEESELPQQGDSDKS